MLLPLQGFYNLSFIVLLFALTCAYATCRGPFARLLRYQCDQWRPLALRVPHLHLVLAGCWSRTDISVRNVAQHGFFFRFRTTHFGCPEVIRDFRWLVSWFAISFLAAVCLFLVQKTFSVKHSIKPAGLWGAYGAIQVILLGSTTLFIYVTPISPAVSAVSASARPANDARVPRRGSQ